jgi:hypothetical protein
MRPALDFLRFWCPALAEQDATAAPERLLTAEKA